jgi:dTDP-4-amino-4,6-dideoxygalactose transaminase
MLFARASTGLYVLFRVLRETRGPGDVIIPAICCESVALAAIYAGLRPVIADVEPSAFCLSPISLVEHLSPRTRAVVLVGVFGHVYDSAAFSMLRQRCDAVFIEDLAQNVGALVGGREVGCDFDWTLLSFAPDKIIRGRGGALIQRGAFDDEASCRVAAGLPPAPLAQALRQKSQSLRNLCHALYDLYRADPRINVAEPFRALVPLYHDLIVRQGTVDGAHAVLEQLEGIGNLRAQRYARYLFYRQRIRHPAVEVVDLPSGAMCWRACLLVQTPAAAAALTDRLRDNGLPASNHYFPLNRLIENSARPTADAIAGRVINLWVDESMTAEKLHKTVAVINDFPSLMDNLTQLLQAHHGRTFDHHGPTPAGVDGVDDGWLLFHYSKMLAVLKGDFEIPGAKPSLLDVGCGWGGLLGYCQSNEIAVDYTGIDVVEKMITYARQHFPDGTFIHGDVLDLDGHGLYDYAVCNGIFTQKLTATIPEMERFSNRVMRRMFDISRYGIAFNMMSTRVNFMAERMYYRSPVELLSYCLTELSPRVTLDHGYSSLGRPSGNLYDYAVCVFKNGSPDQ